MSLDHLTAEASRRLSEAAERHSPATFASSFGAEDMVILDLIHRLGLAIDIFTLDTGRLHPETHELIARAQQVYRLPLRARR